MSSYLAGCFSDFNEMSGTILTSSVVSTTAACAGLCASNGGFTL